MLSIREKLDEARPSQARLTLPFELRKKSRLRARLDDDREVGLFLPRGTVLRGGDLLVADDGTVVEVAAKEQQLSQVVSEDRRDLLRAAYHLGNRHVPVQIGDRWLRYEHDHVLDAMLRGLGLTVTIEEAGFEPESGAYSHGGHSHGSHSHSHGGHSHDGDAHTHGGPVAQGRNGNEHSHE